MSWGVPHALLLLLAVIPLIVFLHSLRRRTVRFRTTALFVWEQILKERPLGSRLGWLLHNHLLLLLQLLAAAMLIAALADPAIRFPGGFGGDTIVVLDLSASMKAGQPPATRFERARAALFTLIDELSAGSRMMIIGAGPEKRVLAALTSDRRRLKEIARGIAATDAPGQVREAILFAYSFLKKGTPDRVVVISDGAFDGAGEFPWGSGHLRLIEVQGGGRNIGIVAFELRRRSNEDASEIMLHLRNFSGTAERVPLSLTLDRAVLARESVEIRANGRAVRIFPVEGELEGRLEARLELKDDLATDNHAYLALSGSPAIHVLYIGPGNPFLSRLFRFFPNVRWNVSAHWPPPPELTRSDPDLVIFDRVSPPPLARGNYILIKTVAPGLPIRVREGIRPPGRISSVARHPLTEGVELGDVFVRDALRVVSDTGTPLAGNADGPLLWAYETERLRVLLVAFDLADSDLPLKVAFPLLLHNAAGWVRTPRSEFPSHAVPAGTAYPIQLGNADETVEVTRPSGGREVLKGAGDRLLYRDTLESGFYSFKTPSRAGLFAVNLFDEGESDIRSRIERGERPQGRARDAAADGEDRSHPVWAYLLALALAALAAESLLACRLGISGLPLVCRAAAWGLLVIALIDPKLKTASAMLDIVIGVDVSRSVGFEGAEKLARVLDIAGRRSGTEARTGVVYFGRDPVWVYPPRIDARPVEEPPRVDRERTDLEAVLLGALGQFGEERQKRVLLVTDGNENRGSVARVIPLLRAGGVEVWTLPVSLAGARNEIYLSNLSLPSRVDTAEGFEIRATLESSQAAPVRIKLLRNGVLVREREIAAIPGTQEVTFYDSLRQHGHHQYELLIESPNDTLPENNLLQGVVEVRGPPRVLFIVGDGGREPPLARALAVQGYAVTRASPESRGLTLPELSSFDLVVLQDIPAHLLGQAKMEALESYVRDLGGGLWVVGGSQSYGAGGYYKTPLERVLPLDVRPPARLDMPQVALLFVIDKSGSMGSGPEGGTKLDLAKAAALAAADIMNPTDQVGVLGFDAAWDWVLPFRAVGKGEWISEKLATLNSDGGTDLYKALSEAHRAMAAKQAAIKHVLVLSDGLTDKSDFPALLKRMAGDGITVSTVAVGGDADFKLLAEIAGLGKGRGYVTLDPQSIPQIFTTETLLISRDLLVEKSVVPEITAPVGPLRGFAGAALPPVGGYVLTYPKSNAELLMKAERDPLLAAWRYGLGRVAAFTTDLSGRWGREWIRWEQFPVWASQVARHTRRSVDESRITSEFAVEENRLRLSIGLRSKEGRFLNQLRLKGNLTAARGRTEHVELLQVAPGRYQGRFSSVQSGIHLITVSMEREGESGPLPLITLPFVAPFPQEYRDLRTNAALLNRLIEETGGEMVDPGKIEPGIARLYAPEPERSGAGRSTWPPFAAAGLAFFLGDLVLRHWPREGGAKNSLQSAA